MSEKENTTISQSDLVNLLNDASFEKIGLGLRSTNIFDILQITRSEIRHSNFLGWLLNPLESHGLGEIMLSRFLRELFSNDEAQGLNALDADGLDYSKVDVRREWQNIDLLIVFDDVVICIENKVDSKEHSNQLERYKEILNTNFSELRKVFVYLTPQGDPPKAENSPYIPYSYIQFAESIDRLLDVYGHTLNNKTLNYIQDYLTVLKRHIMQNDELNEMAVKLYKSHRETLDFIFDNRPDIEQELRVLLERKVIESGWIIGSKNKGYVRFLTPKLKKIIPVYDFANGWPDKESFLFEIEYFWNKMAKIRTVISPGEDSTRDALKDIISKVEGSLKPWGAKWVSHFLINKKFSIDKLTELTMEERAQEIEKFWPTVIELVEKVESAILKGFKPN